MTRKFQPHKKPGHARLAFLSSTDDAWERVLRNRKHSPGTPYSSMNYDADKSTFIWSVILIGLLLVSIAIALPSVIVVVGAVITVAALEGHPL